MEDGSPRRGGARRRGSAGWADPLESPARRWLRTELGTLRQAWVLYDDNASWREISADEARRRKEGGTH
ncbi:hypothetical protein [Curtobacterium flaccumfaciens]|uniref:hypothetical protein n=1 Tax=Curtobacterium flaccumfaciens TaxID=2035 RepID=UPI003992F6B9